MKKFIALIALSAMLLTASPVFAIDVVVSNQYIDYRYDQAPVIQNSRTLVPLRSIFEALGANVTWDNQTRTATSIKDGKIIAVQIDNNLASVNGSTIMLDVPATIINNRTMVPVRFIAESYGAKVDWSQELQTVYINSTVPNLAEKKMSPDVEFLLHNNYGAITKKFSLVDISDEELRSLVTAPTGLGSAFPYPEFTKKVANTDILLLFYDAEWAAQQGIDTPNTAEEMKNIEQLLATYSPSPTARVRVLSCYAFEMMPDWPSYTTLNYFARRLGFLYGPDNAASYYTKPIETGQMSPFLQAEDVHDYDKASSAIVTPHTRVGIGLPMW